MMRIFLALVVAIAAVPAQAQECEPTTTQPDVDTGHTSAGRFYYDDDGCQPECKFSVWVYEESNDIDGLQRGDEVVDNTCGGVIESDTIIF